MRYSDWTPWALVDRVLLGNQQLVIDTNLSVLEAQARLQAVSEPEPADDETAYLVVNVNRDNVTAGYEVPFTSNWGRLHGASGIARTFQVVRPLFRGTLLDCEGVIQFKGRFGANDLTRLSAFAALIALVILLTNGFVRFPAGLDTAAWLAIAAFSVMCILTRVNGDDIPFISKNLEYALQGDDTDFSPSDQVPNSV